MSSATVLFILDRLRRRDAPRPCVALAFGLAVGAHRSSGILLPGVLLAYALFTPGRASARRLWDAGGFALGGALYVAGAIVYGLQRPDPGIELL